MKIRGSRSLFGRLALACAGAATALALFAGIVSAAPPPDGEDPQRYAIVDGSGTVINIVRWDGVSPWSPPDGCIAVPDARGEAEIKGRYADGRFVAPIATPDPEAAVREAEFAAREAALAPLRQAIRDRTATHEDVLRYLALRDGLE